MLVKTLDIVCKVQARTPLRLSNESINKGEPEGETDMRAVLPGTFRYEHNLLIREGLILALDSRQWLRSGFLISNFITANLEKKSVG